MRNTLEFSAAGPFSSSDGLGSIVIMTFPSLKDASEWLKLQQELIDSINERREEMQKQIDKANEKLKRGS